jgi:hypothetical protein
MAKVRTTLTLDAEVMRLVKVRADREGKGESQVIEESLRRDLGVGALGQLWDKNHLTEERAMQLAVEGQHSTRTRRRR